MTYGERLNEFVPGHPLFLEEDRQRIANYKKRCELGLPVLPFDVSELFYGNKGPDQQQTPSKAMPPKPITTTSTSTQLSTTPTTTCQHLRTTRKGTYKYYEMETCLDCHEVLKKEKKVEASTTSTTRTQPSVVGGGDQSSCKHERVTWKGSNGFQLKRTCLDCGHKTSGYHSEKRPQQQRHGGLSTSSTLGSCWRSSSRSDAGRLSHLQCGGQCEGYGEWTTGLGIRRPASYLGCCYDECGHYSFDKRSSWTTCGIDNYATTSTQVTPKGWQEDHVWSLQELLL